MDNKKDEKILELVNILKNTKYLVFLEGLEHQQIVVLKILEEKMDYIKHYIKIDIGQKKY